MSVNAPTYDEQWQTYLDVCHAIEVTPTCPFDHAHRGRITGCRWHDLDTRAGQLERDMDRMARARMQRDAAA